MIIIDLSGWFLLRFVIACGNRSVRPAKFGSFAFRHNTGWWILFLGLLGLADHEGQQSGMEHGHLGQQHESSSVTPMTMQGYADQYEDQQRNLHNHLRNSTQQMAVSLRYMGNYANQDMPTSTPTTPTINSTSQNSRRGRGRTVSGIIA